MESRSGVLACRIGGQWVCHLQCSQLGCSAQHPLVVGVDARFEAAVLAIAAGADRIEKLDIVFVPQTELQEIPVAIEETEGLTPVRDLADSHVDVVGIDLRRLGTIARCIARALADNQTFRFSKSRVQHLLVAAVRQDRVALECLSERVRQDVAKVLRKRDA